MTKLWNVIFESMELSNHGDHVRFSETVYGNSFEEAMGAFYETENGKQNDTHIIDVVFQEMSQRRLHLLLNMRGIDTHRGNNMTKSCECTQCHTEYNSSCYDENFCSEKCYLVWCKETNEREKGNRK